MVSTRSEEILHDVEMKILNNLTFLFMERLILKWRVWKIDANIDYGDFKLGGGYSITFDYNDSRPAYINNY